MRDNLNLSIGILSVTAVILLSAFLLSTAGGRGQALAIGQSDRGGDYVVATGQFTQSSELVYVLDAAVRRLNIYSYDKTRRQLMFWESLDLQKLLSAAGP